MRPDKTKDNTLPQMNDPVDISPRTLLPMAPKVIPKDDITLPLSAHAIWSNDSQSVSSTAVIKPGPQVQLASIHDDIATLSNKPVQSRTGGHRPSFSDSAISISRPLPEDTLCDKRLSDDSSTNMAKFPDVYGLTTKNLQSLSITDPESAAMYAGLHRHTTAIQRLEISILDWAASTVEPFNYREGSPRASLDGGVDSISNLHSRSPRPCTLIATPLSITTSISSQGSTMSMKSFEDVDGGWCQSSLLGFSDTLRRSIERLSIPIEGMILLLLVLTQMLADENHPQRAIEIDTIAHTRFDKLIGDIIKAEKKMGMNAIFAESLVKAVSLEHKWQQRFRARYFTIDDLRMRNMRQGGALRNVILDLGGRKKRQKWSVVDKPKSVAEIEGDLTFHPGDWWLNMVCAFRDGIIANPSETATKGLYEFTALVLLSGTEVEGPTLNMYEYMKEGSLKEMHTSLMMMNRGRPIRILRGHELKSQFAPKLGVRYDGLYTVKQYAHRLVDGLSNKYNCSILLERVASQKDVNDILMIPSPSQMDDWFLYHSIFDQNIR